MFNNLTLYTRDYTKPVEVKTKAHCAWQENVEKIMNTVNKSRAEAKPKPFKPYSFGAICGQLTLIGVDSSNIFAFIQECERSNDFAWHYQTKVKQARLKRYESKTTKTLKWSS